MSGELTTVENAGDEFDVWSRALRARMVAVLMRMHLVGIVLARFGM